MGSYDRFKTIPTRSGSTDLRDEGARDRDRILYTSAFRRLGHVTQVVRPSEGHVFHNRLTHTLEVAQIARRLAQRLDKQYATSGATPHLIDPEVAEAAALAHDLGHPPFGHIAERELDHLARENGVSDGYEGNAQSFRIVTRLAAHRRDYRGLNLTRASLNGILKYPWFRGDKDSPRSDKFGAYISERELFRFARAESAGYSQSIEAAIMDHADAVAYSVHDLDDFYRAGLVPLELFDDRAFLDKEIEKFRESGLLQKDLIDEHLGALRSLMTLLPRGTRYGGTFEERAELRTSTSRLINDFLGDVELEKQSSGFTLVVPPSRTVQMKFLQNVVWRHVIKSPQLAAQQEGQRRIVEGLFRAFLDSIRSTQKGNGSDHRVFNIVPPAFQDVLAQLPMNDDSTSLDTQQVRLACDIVASLSDEQASAVFWRFTGVRPGFVTDLY